jgi:hypothetical protein
VVVDGAPRPGTACTLSHWPGTPTPRSLWADTSAEIVLRARRHPRALPAGVELATIDHFDADGAIALALLVDDELAGHHGRMLAAAANAGDFDVVVDRDAGLVAFAVAALGDGRSLAEAAVAVLDALPGLAADPRHFEELWGPEAEAFDASTGLLANGAVVIEEHPDLDLAVVRVEVSAPALARAGWAGAVVHPAAVHSATACLRVATLAGPCYELRYRYESWIRLVSRRPRPRVDLTALADRLSRLEPDGGAWAFDGAGAITPALRRADGESSGLGPEQFVEEVAQALRQLDAAHAPAWDPYGDHGG